MSILPTWPFAVGALVLGLAGGAWIDHTVMASRIAKIEKDHADMMRQLAEVHDADQIDARTKEQTWAARVGQVEQEKTNENARIAARYAAQLDGLRQRADRRPAPTSGMLEAATACAGATGAELSRPDATVLVGFAQRADEQRAALAACYGAYDALK